jgi:hypothetical protein
MIRIGQALSHNATSILLRRLLFVFYFVPVQAELDQHFVKNKKSVFSDGLVAFIEVPSGFEPL